MFFGIFGGARTCKTSHIMSVDVTLNYIPVVNFSMQQNHVRIIREIAVENTGATNLEDIDIAVSFDPLFAEVSPLHVDRLPVGTSVQLTDVPVHILTTYLSDLTERIEGVIKIEVKSDDKILASKTYDISLLAFDQWAGLSVLPAMLASFVTPNHPELVAIIRRASDILAKWTGSPSFDEYQTRDPNRVKLQMAAIYEAIAEQQIAYCTVPASFEDRGQRVRMAGDILSGRLATCLDMTLLYASCLEAVGINPLLVMIQGHAFVGAWLIPESFPDSVNDDVSLLTKRTAEGINEILLVETTCMNAGAIVPFDGAVAAANDRLKDADRFQLFIDVLRARNAQIRPLPLRVAREGGGYDIEDPAPVARPADAPTSMGATHVVEDVDHISVTKQTIWERKLLDLSLRNNLLNTRITNNTLQLISANVSELEDALAAGVEFQILPKPEDWDNPLMSEGIYQALNASNPIIDLVKGELKQKHLYSYLNDESLRLALTRLYRSSRLALEENGANTLYLAVGLLKWFETPSSTRPRFAPILLLPIEIIRKSAAKGFMIRSRDEDTALNITLLEMLRQDFGIGIGGLETLPTDENGVDVAKVFNVFRRAIMSESRWDVEEQAILGNFSFSKFIMWNDIHNNADKLARNHIVASLISGKTEWDEDIADTDEINLDEAYPAGTVALPIGADSSQFEAICTAVDNKSFILHGPPGTGKSQTITNIIANALYNGKKVLFVAEKMAALQVVQRRLEAIGLAPFCLELHSNKTKKSYILEQLKRTTEIVKRKPAEEFRVKAQQLNDLRRELNGYVQAVHRMYPAGVSLYDCFTRYAAVGSATTTVRLSDEVIEAATPDSVANLAVTAAEYRSAARVCGSPATHPLAGIGVSDYSATLRSEAGERLKDLYTGIGSYQTTLEDVAKVLKYNLDNLSAEQKVHLDGILKILLESEAIPVGLLESPSAAILYDVISATVECGRERDGARSALLRDFSDGILAWEYASWEARWRESATKWWLPRVLGRMKVKKQLKAFARGRKSFNTDEVTAMFAQLDIYARCQSQLESQAGQLAPVLGPLWDVNHADWDRVGGGSEAVRELNRLILLMTQDLSAAAALKSSISAALGCGLSAFRELNGAKLLTALECGERVDAKAGRLQELLVTRPLSELSLLELKDTAVRWADNIGLLRDKAAYNLQRARMIDAGLGAIVTALETDEIGEEEIEDCFSRSFYRGYAEYILSKEHDLNSFHGMLFDEKLERFRQFSAEFERLTREELYARLATNLPALQKEAAQSSEVGILQRNIRNGGRGTSIRRLFDQIPDLLTRMCPCMLMSPISVAQYIDAERVPFDLVIFDEASQMPTSEAVGAIARGQNVIVVGDPKQMPPTSFFNTNTFDEDNADKEDMENILEDCLALTMPSKYLRWHYRSRHESLIAFSNIKYYDNRLYTFPSPDDLTTKVGWQYVEGVYDRGRSRQNRAEAEAVVAEIKKRLSAPEGPLRSIGVVTFNTNQQSLIEDLLTDLFSANPDLEAVAGQSEEPIFIKNLENVQGDERDVILFSIGYGPDKDGRIALNFGPLNRDGGGRRLNVAVSRARYEMKVFSTLKSEQIDLNRTSADGVADLKAFLEYAEKGRDFIAGNSARESNSADALVESVAAELRTRGHNVRTNIGCSGYKIDVGVVDPAEPDKYLLGVLFDGHSYGSSRTANDRVVTQHSVLRQLGWQLYRVWSMDWWENQAKTIDAIEAAIAKAKEKPVAKPKPQPAKAEVRADSAPIKAAPAPEKDEDPYVLPYKQCLQMSVHLSSDEFSSGEFDNRILKRMGAIVAAEAPISKNLLGRRVIVSYGITRMSPRVSAHFDELLKQTIFVQSGTDAPFFWNPGQDPEAYANYRPDSSREALDIAPEEMAVAVVRILKDQMSLPLDGLRKEVAQTFHFSRLTENVTTSVNRGIDYALARGRIIIENDRAKPA